MFDDKIHDHDCIATIKLTLMIGKIYGDRHELPAAVGIKGGSEILPLMGIGDNVSLRRLGNMC